MVEWHAISREEALKMLDSSEKGISDSAAKLRLEKYGKNELHQVLKIRPITIFLQQFKSVFIFILLLAAIFSLIIGHYIDFSVILAIVFLNAIIGFIQQFKAEKTIMELKSLLVPKVRVFRENRLMEISSTELVPGDIIQIEEGDKIMADCRLIHDSQLEVNEAILTGESMPQSKSSETIKLYTELANRENMLYMGTLAVKGNGRALVVATNSNTEFGKIANLVQEIRTTKTPLEKKIDHFSKIVAIIVVIAALLAFLVGVFSGKPLEEMIFASIALAISVIPEGAPAIIAITLALAIGRMRKTNSLVRKLPAAETLGRTTVICVDKTGTLTEEEMTVTKLYCNKQFYTVENNAFIHENKKINPLRTGNLDLLLKVGIMCNNARIEKDKNGKILGIIGDPTEKSFVISADKAGILKQKETEKELRLIEYSFSSKRKMMSIVRELSNKHIRSYVKGAPDLILKKSIKEIVEGRLVPLTEKRREELIAVYHNLASQGLRVLGFAYRDIAGKYNQEVAESNLIFVGFQGIMDPPRKEVANSIRDCLSAGINVKMLTGDSLLTAEAVSRMIGLDGGSIEGKDLERLSEEEFNKIILEKNIFARITPEIKYKIVLALKNQGEVVAVTGDGVNDVLALKEADIGVAMGIRGSEVAREVSDIILLDDNFNSIVKAVKEGRRVYDNMKKSITAHISANVGELFMFVVALLFFLPLPLLPLAILWMNLITDSLPSLSLAFEPPEKNVMRRKPLSKNENLVTGLWSFLILAGLLSTIISIIVFLIYYQTDLAKARTLAITTLVFCEMFIVISCRSERNIWQIGFFSNKFLVYSIWITIILQLLAIYTPLGNIFEFVPLSILEVSLVFIFSSLILVFFETKKFFTNRKNEKL